MSNLLQGLSVRYLFVDQTNAPDYDYVSFDAISESTNRRTADVTQHPVEEGSVIADHVTTQPRELDMVGIISGVPTSLLAWASRSSTYVYDSYDKLHQWMTDKANLLVFAVDDYYESMQLVGIERGHDHTKGKAAHLHLTFREIVVVSTRTVDAPTPKTARGASRKAKGQKAAKTSESTEANETLLLSIGNLLGG
jgi:hypothetical protein